MEFSKLIFEPTVDLKLPPVPVSFIEVVFSDVQKIDLDDPLCTSAPLPFGISPLIQSEVVSGRLLTRGDDVKETFELSLDIKEQFSYLPGDSVGVFPQNPLAEVNQLLKRLGLDEQKNAPIEITVKKGVKKKLPIYLPLVSTPKIILESVLEIRGILKKGFLRSLAEYTTEYKEKRRLLELSSIEGAAEYDKYILQQGLTLSDVLTEIPSCVPPLSLLLEHLPRLMPRAYSIASSPLSCGKRINIVFNLVVTPRGRMGVCSSWLKNKFEDVDDLSKKFEKMGVQDSSPTRTSKTIPLFFRKPSNFRIPTPIDAPLILIGPGTGVAPFIGKSISSSSFTNPFYESKVN
uniref:Methionine synthase reductase n=2 Tax=Lygus hesperus TaxID=30085 RepID=A0A0A9ZI52_LYGHE